MVLMAWINEYEVDDLHRWFDDLADQYPNMAKAAQALSNYRHWVNSNSDGWSYWAAGSEAASMLIVALKEAQPKIRHREEVQDFPAHRLSALVTAMGAMITQYTRANEDPQKVLFPPPPPPPPVQRFVYLAGDEDGPDLHGVIYPDEDPAMECAVENDGVVWKIAALLLPATMVRIESDRDSGG